MLMGNSNGASISKFVLGQCPFKKPRQGWDEAFQMMSQRGDDKLLIEDNMDLDMEGWGWGETEKFFNQKENVV